MTVADGSTLSLTGQNDGQYTALAALPFRARTPFAGASRGWDCR